ncbi:MAG: hypothetical protein V3V14_00055 [Saprospiraceae bacterium]
MKKKQRFGIKEIHSMDEFLKNDYIFANSTIQEIDFSKVNINWKSLDIDQAIFLGCTLKNQDQIDIIESGGIIFPSIKNLCYKPYRSKLYNWQELYKIAKSGNSVDLDIYNHFSEYKYAPPMKDALLQRIHDHCIDDALNDYLGTDKDGSYNVKSIGIMGGHGTKRTDEYYIKVAKIAQKLTQQGYLIMTGGGPGIMEAANLGGYMSNYSEKELDDALTILQKSNHYTEPLFHETAVEVIEKFPNGKDTLAIPTWFYGHEPSNLFASHIAKYFSNSIREDTLLALSIHGILFAPGSAGTTQEIFMDAAQNHYTTFTYASPMIFLGKKRYKEETNIYQTLSDLAKGKTYARLMRLVDNVDDAVKAFEELKPTK